MTRFEFKLKVNFIDEETGEEIYHKVLIDNSNGNEIGFDDMVGLLNNLHQENNILNKNEEDLEECTIENIKLKEENEKLRKQLESSETTSNATSHYNAFLELKITILEKENEQLRQQSEHYRKNRDKWKQKALAKDEQLKDCNNDCFNCRFYNKVCDFCTKFHIYTMTSGDGV